MSVRDGTDESVPRQDKVGKHEKERTRRIEDAPLQQGGVESRIAPTRIPVTVRYATRFSVRMALKLLAEALPVWKSLLIKNMHRNKWATAKHSICAMKFPADPMRSPQAEAIRAILTGTGESHKEKTATEARGKNTLHGISTGKK